MNYCLILIYSLLTLTIDAFLDEATEDNFREYQNDDWKYEFPYFKGNKGAFGWLKKEKKSEKIFISDLYSSTRIKYHT